MDTESYQTLDGSIVTELVNPEIGGSENVSLAHAMVKPGQTTHTHIHRESEEIYYILTGEGVLQIGATQIKLQPGDARLIKAGQEHRVTCHGDRPLEILCVCSPPYSDDDTVLTGPVTA